MKKETKQILRDFGHATGEGAQYLLLAALFLICVSMFGFAVLFSDEEAAQLIKLIFGN